MRTVLLSFIAAIVGGLVTYGAFSLGPEPVIDRTQYVSTIEQINRPSATLEPTEELSPTQIYDRYGDAVVHVSAVVSHTFQNFFGLPQPENQISSGSGFIVSKQGYVITNAHVVSGADQINVQFADQSEVAAKLVGIDQSTDIAVLRIDLKGQKYHLLELGDSRNARVGQTVHAIGNPLGYDRSMSTGIISALNREIRAPNNFPIRGVIQTDAAINRGNSGGPLISSTGKVLGVTSQIATTGEGSIGIAFAVPSSTVRKIYEEILETGTASHAWLGIEGTTLASKIAKDLKLPAEAGAMVIDTIENGPAAAAGLRGADSTIELDGEPYRVGGDIITKINSRRVSSMEDLITELAQYRSGETIKLTMLRDNKLITVNVKLGERPSEPQPTENLFR